MFYVLFGILCTIILNYHYLVADEIITLVKEKDLKDFDWDVWCKLQPNSFDCGKDGGSRFYFDIKMEGCKSFTYGGCPTAYNSFKTLSSCHESCRDAGEHPINFNLSQKVICRLQPDFGLCNDYKPMYYFDIASRTCKGFSYSGCGGNHNRFDNSQICNSVCSAITPF